MRFFLDEVTPVAVGRELEAHDFRVIYFRDAALPGTPDTVVSDIAMANDAVLVAVDRDMKQVAKAHGITNARFKRLSLLSLRCREPETAERLRMALPFIKLRLEQTVETGGRRMFAEIYPTSVKILDI